MTVSLEIVPFADSLDMYGEPDNSVAYSLSGHISLSLSSTSIFGYGYGRPSQLLLSSLVVTFEGQSEMIAEETGYAAIRLCSISQECVPGEPIELVTSDDSGTCDEPCNWNVVFNLTVPGWLPATSVFGQSFSGVAGTRYTLHAVAKFQSPSSATSNSWFSMLCLPLRFTSQTVKAPKLPIALNRFTSPSCYASTSSSLFPMTNYMVSVQSEDSIDDPACPPIPTEVLSKLRVAVTIPEQVGTEEATVPLNLRLRTEGLSESQCKRLRIEEFQLSIDQTEKYRSLPLSAYTARHPLPPRNQQPPNLPLLDHNPMQTIFELGLSPSPPRRQVLSRSFSLLPADHSRRFVLAGDGYIFNDDATTTEVSWYSMNTDIAIEKTREVKDEYDWKQTRVLRESGHTPFFSVQHQLNLSLTCTYDLTEGENPKRATRHLSLALPIRFVRTPPMESRTHLSPSSSCSSLVSLMETYPLLPKSVSSDYLPHTAPYNTTLPPYSQLFESNGDRKIDYSIALPLYTPRPSAEAKRQASLDCLEDFDGVTV